MAEVTAMSDAQQPQAPEQHAQDAQVDALATSVAAASLNSSSGPSKSQKKVQHLVVDSGAIIKGTDLAPLAEVRSCVAC